MFKLINSCPRTQARFGELTTLHGVVSTPVFLPVGSQGTVKTVTPEELHDIGTTMILGNTYHLYLRPGIDTIERLGGLHKFMAWQSPILTDSGGYQVFSLSPLCKIDEQGIVFRSHIDGSEHSFSPESAIEFQERLGADVIMVLDECASINEKEPAVKEAMLRTHRWAERCLKHHHNNGQLLFAIVQGGIFPEMRRQSARALTAMDFPGYAIGGLSLGESKELTWNMVEAVIGLLPQDKPRYLMGVGSPEDIIEGVSRGIDIFDCALPTRVARNGALFTMEGRKNIDNAIFKIKEEPFDDSCDCYMCRNFSTAYLHHLFKCGELLAYRLATIHNLRFITRLMSNMREAIKAGTFLDFKDNFLARYQVTNESVRISQKQKWLNARRESNG
jgi:queuine tRNA-ribosyltransferase